MYFSKVVYCGVCLICCCVVALLVVFFITGIRTLTSRKCLYELVSSCAN